MVARVGCTGRARLKAVGARARAERTWNMLLMVVTLDVSKLSGWLNADANCRVERAGMRCGKRCGAGGVRALGGGDASGMCTGRAPTQGLGAKPPTRCPSRWSSRVETLGKAHNERILAALRDAVTEVYIETDDNESGSMYTRF